MTTQTSFEGSTPQSINYELFLTTGFFFIAGIAYYLYKFRNTVASNVNDRIIRTDNNQHSVQPSNFGEHLNSNTNQFQSSSRNTNEGQFESRDTRSNEIHIIIQLPEGRKNFIVIKDQKIRDFINITLSPAITTTHNPRISLFCAGRKLDDSKAFQDYPMIANQTVIHCFVQSGENQTREERQYMDYQDDVNSVHFHTLLFHGMALVMFIGLVTLYKSWTEIFTITTLRLIKVLCIVWIIIFSKCIAKLIVYGRITYA